MVASPANKFVIETEGRVNPLKVGPAIFGSAFTGVKNSASTNPLEFGDVLLSGPRMTERTIEFRPPFMTPPAEGLGLLSSHAITAAWESLMDILGCTAC